ncbi:phage virion structural protein [Salmonella phage SPFM14]|nr:phage virion structural protein [Salmonella phage SPFM14]
MFKDTLTVYYVVVDQTSQETIDDLTAQLGGDFDDYNMSGLLTLSPSINNASSVMVVCFRDKSGYYRKMMEKKNANWLSYAKDIALCNDLIEEYRKNPFSDQTKTFWERVLRAKVGSPMRLRLDVKSLPTDEMKTLIVSNGKVFSVTFERDGNKVELPSAGSVLPNNTLKLLHDQEGLGLAVGESRRQKSDNKVATECLASFAIGESSRHTLPSYDKTLDQVSTRRNALDAAARSGSRNQLTAISILVGVPEVDILGSLLGLDYLPGILEKIQILLAESTEEFNSVLYNEHTTLVEQIETSLVSFLSKFPMLLRQRAVSVSLLIINSGV